MRNSLLAAILLASVAGAAEYEVAYSSWSSSSGNIWMEERSVVYSKDKHKRAVDCFGEQGCLDLAYALNEAHEKQKYIPYNSFGGTSDIKFDEAISSPCTSTTNIPTSVTCK